MRSSKKSLFEACESQQTHVDPLSAIYGSLRDDSQARGKRTYVWAELLAMFQRRFTVRTLSCSALQAAWQLQEAAHVHWQARLVSSSTECHHVLA